MGSMPVRSILKGPAKLLCKKTNLTRVEEIFEHTVEEFEKVKSDNNNNAAEGSEPIYSIVVNSEVSQETALLYQGRRTKLSELNESANQLGRAILARLRSLGRAQHRNSEGDFIVVVCLEPSDTLVVTLLACLKIGAAYLPVDPSFPSHRVEHILGESDPALVITERNKIRSQLVTDVESLLELAKGMPGGNLDEQESAKSPTAIVLYTSGSTGVPKGVRLSHAAVLNRLVWQWETFPYSKTEKVCVFKTALTFVDSVSEIWGPLLNARTLLIVPKEDAKDAERIMDILEEHNVERLVLVPTLLQSMLLYLNLSRKKNAHEQRLKSLRIWVSSGEPLLSSLVKEFFEYFDVRRHVLCNFYGSTEVMGDATYHVVDTAEEVEAIIADGRVPIGSPVYNTVVYLLDEKLDPVNMGETGEVYISGSCLTTGYVRGRDANRFTDNNVLVDSGHPKLYRTGDYGVIRKNTLYFKGRTDSQIKVRGNRVDLSEIDTALKSVPGVEESAVLAYNPGQEDQAIVAFVCLGKITRAELQSRLEESLPGYMTPHIIALDSLPLLVNGKVDRQSLLKKYKNDYMQSAASPGVINYEGIEEGLLGRAKDVFETVAEALGDGVRSMITPDSNFYHLGGNSLNSVHFITRLRDLGYSIGIKDLLGAPTLMDVIRRVSKGGDGLTMADLTDVNELRGRYTTEMISEELKKDYEEVICTSFYKKADIEAHLEPPVPYSHYTEVVNAAWKLLLRDQLSFVVRDAKGEIVGAAMNMDAHNEGEFSFSPENRLSVVFAFLDFVEMPVMQEKLPRGQGKILHSIMMASKDTLSTQETIELFIYMEDQIMNMAKSLNFVGVFSTNTSPLTQQLSRINKYQILVEYPANQYVANDGTRPFANAPDDVKASVAWKPV